ncbi:MAG: ATP-binding protein [Candidatus Ornithospirochaeta sp.]|nr:ATP-binding protein [Candidatus Ornithospirochaeta sp.]
MIGRKKETKELNRLYESNKSELVAVYGRYRVGKTFLIDEVFSDRISFRHTGLSPESSSSKGLLYRQLEHFYNSLLLQGMPECNKPKSWSDAFLLLERHLIRIDDGSRQLVFIDELPWLDTPRSEFISAFEGFWNSWGCHRKNLMVIVCGSANSWILDNLINAHGGLYNRLTYVIKLEPFSLGECKDYYESRNIRFSSYDIIQSYMVFGGIPYYMGYVDGEKSLAQNIDDIFFAHHAKLEDEFDRLFASVFNRPEFFKSIVSFLATRNSGYTRSEIITALGITDGSTITKSLHALIASSFIMEYVPFGFSKREIHYKLTDPFCLFYLQFIHNRTSINEEFWSQNASSQRISAWRGYAFENVCFNHIKEIKMALGISGVISSVSAWSKKGDDSKGTQIDLLIIRNDNVINMCEIKFYSGLFEVDKDYYITLMTRENLLKENVSPKNTIRNTLITTFGLKRNEYSSVFSNVVVIDDLFSGYRH